MRTDRIARNLVDVRIMLSALWVARMLTGFVGDVLKLWNAIDSGIFVGSCNNVRATCFYGLSVPDAAG